MYVWNKWYPNRLRKLNTTAKQVKFPKNDNILINGIQFCSPSILRV